MLRNIEIYDYQRKAVEKALKAFAAKPATKVNGFFIGDKMGLGKTVEALMIADELPKTHNLIAIICPAFLVPRWCREILNKCPTPTAREYKFIVESYSSLTDVATLQTFCTRRYDLIIFDEAHYFKNYRAQRTRAAIAAAKCGDYLLALSGTWPPNNVADTYNWLRMTNNPLARCRFEDFIYRHAAFVQRTTFGLRYEGFKPSEFWRQHFDPYFIAREIDDVTDAIPDGLRIFETVEIPEKLAREEQQIFAELLAASGLNRNHLDAVLADEEEFERLLRTIPDFSRLTEFRKRQGLAKIPAALNWISEAWEEKQKILVFAYHHEVAEKFAAECQKKKMPVVLVHGANTSAEEREQILYAAQQQSEIVLIVTIDAAREGVDLIEFDTTLFLEYDWRPWALEQAEGRTRRIGQSKPVRWVYMTFDVGIDAAMRRKVNSKARAIAQIRGQTA